MYVAFNGKPNILISVINDNARFVSYKLVMYSLSYAQYTTMK